MHPPFQLVPNVKAILRTQFLLFWMEAVVLFNCALIYLRVRFLDGRLFAQDKGPQIFREAKVLESQT